MATDPDETGENEWRFSLDDLEEGDEEDGEDEGGGGNVAGSLVPDEEVEAGDIDLENALFVVAGMILAILVLAGFIFFL
jgi:hypothetical protein